VTWRERFREDNELLFTIFGPFQRKLYAIAAALTFFYQVRPRWEACEGYIPCGISGAKAVFWAIVWPVYWINRVTGDPIGLFMQAWRGF
jgi:hypothetical protein